MFKNTLTSDLILSVFSEIINIIIWYLKDMDFVGHRQRSYTDQRLEIMRKEKKNASKIKRITWKHNPAQINGESVLFSLWFMFPPPLFFSFSFSIC